MSDIRYGNSPFPYGPNYDMGISLNRIVGVASDPNGLTEGVVYAEMTLHESFAEAPASWTGSSSRTIWIKADLLGETDQIQRVTIRLGDSFSVSGAGFIRGRVAGVVSAKGLVGLFSWRTSAGTVELFPDGALRVFDDVLTAEDIDGTSWGGAAAYQAATAGAPIYYFYWDSARGKLYSPAKRVLSTVAGDEAFGLSASAFGVFVPLDGEGVPQTPLAAFVVSSEDHGLSCAGSIESVEGGITTASDDTLNVGAVSLTQQLAWGAPGGGSTTYSGSATPSATVAYQTQFANPTAGGTTSGYFFTGWYNPALGISEEGQNTAKILLSDTTSLALVGLLSEDLAFVDGSAETPNELYLTLEPAEGATPSLAAELTFGVSASALETNGSASALLASAWTGATGILYCDGTFYRSMWVNLTGTDELGYNTLADGTSDGQFAVWSATADAWVSGDSPLPDGTATGDVLTWTGTEWTAQTSPAMIAGADKATMFYDGTLETPGWTANSILQWAKYAGSAGSSTGGDLVIDLTSCPTRAWDAVMPGLLIKHPGGGTCGLFANVEAGADAGPRLDMGWGGAGGGNFELYSNSHATRPGEFRVVYGPSGHVEFKNYRGGSNWEVTAGITKEGRMFCGFNDSGFPGSDDTYGDYSDPPYPFQVFDENSHDCTMVAGVTKEGRGFFGLAGAMPTAGVEHPVEVYNEDGTPARVAYLSKTGKILTTATAGALTHAAQLDCADIAFATETPSAQTVKLREMVVPYLDGGVVKGKLAQVMCGAGYGDPLQLGGRPADPTAAAERGSTGEADLSASSAFDPASPEGADGVALILSLGCFYDDTAGTPVLKEYRVRLTWPNAIAPKVSSAYTVTIDTPQA